jgi:microcin-processing peptidase 2. Unknown type peptidase. MEROPS family U62
MSITQTAVRDRLHLELPQAFNATQPLEVARQAILAPSGLDEDRIAGVLGNVMGYSVDYADLYFQLSREESWSLEDGIVKDGSHSIEQGVGVRALAGEKTGFAYSDEIILPALTEASLAARAIARSGANKSSTGVALDGGPSVVSALRSARRLERHGEKCNCSSASIGKRAGSILASRK